PTGSMDWDPAWSPDSSRVAFTSTASSGNPDIYISDTDGTNRRSLGRFAGNQHAPAWSPGGDRIAFLSGGPGKSEIHIADVDGGSRREITRGAAAQGSLTWAADGSRLAVVSRRDGNAEVYVVVVATGDMRNLSRHPAQDDSPVWSPDGTTVAFESMRDGNTEVYAADVAGGGLTNVSNHPTSDGAPSWSPDGAALAFASNRDGDWDIYTIAVAHTPDPGTGDPITGDVNGDGRVDIIDLVMIAQAFGSSGQGLPTDANSDGLVNIIDLVTVASHFGKTAGVVTASPQHPDGTHSADISEWLRQARARDNGSDLFRRGISALEGLLALATPRRTTLLPNYPNPFNPETWLPFQLADAASVSVVIYDAHGKTVRLIELGVRAAGTYRERQEAAHWDGRNAQGERVSSGTYYAEFRAGATRQTQRLLVQK
ncbi:hypothetical protein HOK31_25510, partial [Candidatus Poribacteria bacterium]|nr:hypothetical protein [Candidatus Poribacteria bacterium]